MTTCVGKIRSSDEESGVKVRRESANRLRFRQIGVFGDLSDKNIALDDQKHWRETSTRSGGTELTDGCSQSLFSISPINPQPSHPDPQQPGGGLLRAPQV